MGSEKFQRRPRGLCFRRCGVVGLFRHAAAGRQSGFGAMPPRLAQQAWRPAAQPTHSVIAGTDQHSDDEERGERCIRW